MALIGWNTCSDKKNSIAVYATICTNGVSVDSHLGKDLILWDGELHYDSGIEYVNRMQTQLGVLGVICSTCQKWETDPLTKEAVYSFYNN